MVVVEYYSRRCDLITSAADWPVVPQISRQHTENYSLIERQKSRKSWFTHGMIIYRLKKNTPVPSQSPYDAGVWVVGTS